MSKEREPLVKHIFTADPSARVFDNRLYVYPSHDIPHDGIDDDEGVEYQMEDYHVLSADRPEGDWTDHGEALHEKDVPWVGHQMWAPDAICKNGIYYLIYPAKDKDGIFRLGMAKSESPTGPFTPEAEPIPGSFSIDPALLMEEDGRVYVYNGGLWGGQMESVLGNPSGKEPALGPVCGILSEDMKSYAVPPKQLVILDEKGDPLTAEDEDRRYFEGPWVHKYQGTYYLSYSTGTTHYIVYATADNPMGPFTYRGRILEPVVGWTTHHSIVEFEGKWYLFYHDCILSGGINHRRTVKYMELHYREDGSIVTLKP